MSYTYATHLPECGSDWPSSLLARKMKAKKLHWDCYKWCLRAYCSTQPAPQVCWRQHFHISYRSPIREDLNKNRRIDCSYYQIFPFQEFRKLQYKFISKLQMNCFTISGNNLTFCRNFQRFFSQKKLIFFETFRMIRKKN